MAEQIDPQAEIRKHERGEEEALHTAKKTSDMRHVTITTPELGMYMKQTSFTAKPGFHTKFAETPAHPHFSAHKPTVLLHTPVEKTKPHPDPGTAKRALFLDQKLMYYVEQKLLEGNEKFDYNYGH